MTVDTAHGVNALVAAAGGQVPAYRTERNLPRAQRWCVVIPVINEGRRIERLLERMSKLSISALADLLIVDGGSTDGSLSADLLDRHGVGTLLVKTGPGRLSAQLRCAYAHVLEAGYEGVVTIDGNDKDDPEAVPRFIDALQGGVDFVQASRFIAGGIAENTPWLRHAGIRLLHAPLLSLGSGFHWTDTTQGFRAYSARLLSDPRLAVFRDAFGDYELLAYLSYRAPRLGFRCVELPTARRYPANERVPTKISMVRGNLRLIATLLAVCRGRFDPGR